MSEFDILLADILWRPVLPIAWISLLVLLAVLASLFAYWRLPRMAWWRRTILAALRLAALSLLALIMLGPSQLLDSTSKRDNGRLYIMADVSESMLSKDQSGQTRLEQMQRRWMSESSLQRMSTLRRVEPYQFAEKPVPIAGINQPLAPASGEETFLVQSMSRLIARLKSKPGNTLLLMSDGIDSEDASVERIAVAAKVKQLEIHTVAFGDSSSNPDAALMATTMQEYLYPNESGVIVARIYQVGCSGKKTVLTVKQGEQKQNFPIDFSKRDYAEVRIPVSHEETGQYEYQCSLAALPGEKETGNNLQTVFLTIQPRRMKVLLLEGSPNWDSKFIAQSLRKDERIALTQVSQITPSKRVTIVTRDDDEQQSSFRVPETTDEWSQFDAVLLGRNMENVLSEKSAEALVEQYDGAGISIVFTRGRACDPESKQGPGFADILSKLQPVIWGEGKFSPGPMRVTASGKVMQWFSPTRIGLDVDSAFSRLDGFKTADVIDEVSPIARVVVESQQSPQDKKAVPSIVTRTNQNGSVVTFAGDGLWKWSLLSPENQDLAGFYDSFWSNLIRWLVVGSEFQPGKEASMQISRSNIRVGESLTVDIALKRALQAGSKPTLIISGPDGSSENIPLKTLPGSTPRLRGTFEVVSRGVHEAVLNASGLTPETLSQKFHAYDATVERLNTAAKPINLKMIAEQSNGKFYGPDDCEKFLDQLASDDQASKVPPKAVYIWDRGGLLFLVVLIAGCEWIGRKMGGLI